MIQPKVGDYVKALITYKDEVWLLHVVAVEPIAWRGEGIYVPSDHQIQLNIPPSNIWWQYSQAQEVAQFCTKEEFEFWKNQVCLSSK